LRQLDPLPRTAQLALLAQAGQALAEIGQGRGRERRLVNRAREGQSVDALLPRGLVLLTPFKAERCQAVAVDDHAWILRGQRHWQGLAVQRRRDLPGGRVDEQT